LTSEQVGRFSERNAAADARRSQSAVTNGTVAIAAQSPHLRRPITTPGEGMSLLGCPTIASDDIDTFVIAGLSSAGGPQDWALAMWVRCLAIRPNACHHPAAGRLGCRQKLAVGGSGAWPCWIVQSVHDQNKTDYLAGNSFAE
jgi:hypothetical protein